MIDNSGQGAFWKFNEILCFECLYVRWCLPRRLGIYPALLQYILENGDHEANRFWIIHAPEKNASLKCIQKAGFEYVGKLYLDENDNTTIESNKTALKFQDELEYMDIALSGQTASSCWNCN